MQPSRVTAEDLSQQCPYGLINDEPVPIAETQKRFRQLLKTNTTKTNNFRPSTIYNVICEHDDCAQSETWESRRNFRNFKSKHWNKKHSKDERTKCKVVSYWSTEKTGDCTKLSAEYRLVDDALNYIIPRAQRAIDMDVNSPVDEVKEDSNDDFGEDDGIPLATQSAQSTPLSVHVLNDNSNNRKRNISLSDLHWFVHENVSCL